MNREFQIRFIAGFLVLLTVAAVTLAWINFRKESQFVAPYDGVWWVERGQYRSCESRSRGPGDKRESKPVIASWQLIRRPVTNTGEVSQLYHDGYGQSRVYAAARPVHIRASPILAPAERSTILVQSHRPYLSRHRTLCVVSALDSPGSTHFYIFCVVSFIFYAFKYTGKLNAFDWTI